jgi:hypothetical protein
MKRALEAFSRTVAQAYLATLMLITYAFPVIFVFAAWVVLGIIIDSLELSRALGKGVLIGLFVIGFGMALFFSVYVWPRVSPMIGKVMDALGETEKKKALIDCDPKELDLEMLTFLQSSVMAKLLLVNNEMMRRYTGLGKVVNSTEWDNRDEYLRTFFKAVDRCEQLNVLLEARLAEVMPKEST